MKCIVKQLGGIMSNKHTPEPWLVETFMRPKGEVTQVAAFSEDGNRILCCVVESFKKIEDAALSPQRQSC